MSKSKSNKFKILFLSLLFDGIGMLSFVIPGIGEFSDVIWAPISAWAITRLYRGNIGKAAGVVTFVEEIVPGLDVIPTFTIMWIYTYIIADEKARKAITE